MPADRRALVELSRAGGRREWTFGEIAERSQRLAGTLRARGVRRGDVVMTVVGNRSEWVLTMLACFRLGAPVLPCTEQLRPRDLALRIATTAPAAVVADERNATTLDEALQLCEEDPLVLLVPDERLFTGEPFPGVDVADTDPCLLTFTSGTSGEPKAVVHGQRWLFGQEVQATHWLAPRAGELVWCTAASGWSKSARNAFIAPWLRGAAGLLHDARFDVDERLAVLAAERVDVLCMAPTEYRMIAKLATLSPLPALRSLVAAGEALDADVLATWKEATGLDIRDGYGQTETGQLTGNPPGITPRPGSMGVPLPGVELSPVDGELVLRSPGSSPTFFLGYLGDGVVRGEDGAWHVDDRARGGPWRTGDAVRVDEDGYLCFEGRTDDVIISSGYRIGPAEVESTLAAHPAVREVAVVGRPDPERGAVVCAYVVLRDGHVGDARLAEALQRHVKEQTAPYKYPRAVEFVDELPRTTTGKIRRSALRAGVQPREPERSPGAA